MAGDGVDAAAEIRRLSGVPRAQAASKWTPGRVARPSDPPRASHFPSMALINPLNIFPDVVNV